MSVAERCKDADKWAAACASYDKYNKDCTDSNADYANTEKKRKDLRENCPASCHFCTKGK